MRPRRGKNFECCKLNTKLRVIYSSAPVSISLVPLTLSLSRRTPDGAVLRRRPLDRVRPGVRMAKWTTRPRFWAKPGRPGSSFARHVSRTTSQAVTTPRRHHLTAECSGTKSTSPSSSKPSRLSLLPYKYNPGPHHRARARFHLPPSAIAPASSSSPWSGHPSPALPNPTTPHPSSLLGGA